MARLDDNINGIGMVRDPEKDSKIMDGKYDHIAYGMLKDAISWYMESKGIGRYDSPINQIAINEYLYDIAINMNTILEEKDGLEMRLKLKNMHHCKFCDFICYDSKELMRHLKTAHAERGK